MTNPNNLTPSQALQKRLEILASMISMGEKIAWGSDSALMLEAAAMLADEDTEITRLRALLDMANTTIAGQESRLASGGKLPEWAS